MQDKIVFLMEETGCEQGEAELALEMCGYEVQAAVKAIPRLFKNIIVLKGKFTVGNTNAFGLFLIVLNSKSGVLLRSRAVMSFNPAVYTIPLEQDWFEFEKHLYGCRLWEGSMQAESLDIEQHMAGHFRGSALSVFEDLRKESEDVIHQQVEKLLEDLFPKQNLKLKIERDILDLGQFKSLKNDAETAWENRPKSSKSLRTLPKTEELLILKVSLIEDPNGIAATSLRAGDMVLARITDQRDIAQYLAKLFGGYSADKGPLPVLAPVEAVESGPDGVLARVRFSAGVCGDATVGRNSCLRASRVLLRAEGTKPAPWWRRFFSIKNA